MKFLHSPSSCSSTSEPNYAPTSCIPSLLRRLLCFHTLPTLPFDHYSHQNEEFCESNEFDEDSKQKGDVGIVAKLMGLDSMPTEFRKKGRCVLDVPSFVEVENDHDKFIVLSFEELNLSKRRKGLGDKKNQEKPFCRIQEFDGEDVISSDSGFDKNCKKMCGKEGKLRKKLVEKEEIESDSENSSPVSVLEFLDHQEDINSGKEDSKLRNSNLRRELRGDLDKNDASPSTSSSTISCDTMDDGVEIGKRYVGLKKKKCVSRRFKKTWEEICIMAEKDVMNSSRKQKERWKCEDFEEISVCLESQILDQLILELITIT